jgi:hypothetical protein
LINCVPEDAEDIDSPSKELINSVPEDAEDIDSPSKELYLRMRRMVMVQVKR